MANPVGRPSTYDPKFCYEVQEMGEHGASKHEMALTLGCGWSTFHRWQEEHEEFRDAVKAASLASQGWWEWQGRQATFGQVPNFNATAFIFNMKNRFPDDWRDKQERELSGGVTIKHEDALGELE